MTIAALYCISAGRPSNVPTVQGMFPGWLVTFVVPTPQAPDYRLAGAQRILPVPKPPDGAQLPAQRNAALNDADQWLCIQTDDDPKKLSILRDGKATPATLDDYLKVWLAAMQETGARLAGCSPTPNLYFVRDRVAQAHFIMGQLFAAAPSPVRFDESLPVREDYDYTCQHLDAHGTVARCDTLLPNYTHWTNRGGCQAYRSPDLDKRINHQLVERWPHYLRPHPKRPSELLLRARKP